MATEKGSGADAKTGCEAPARRVFVGLRIAPQIARELAEAARDLPQTSVRVTPIPDLHLTLVPPWNETSISTAAEKLGRVAARGRAFSLKFRRLDYGPRPRQPRLLWAECEAGKEIAALRASLAAAFGERDDRPFRPHVTIARIPHDGRKIAREHSISRELPLAQRVETVELFQSPPAGERGYEVLVSARLGKTHHFTDSS
jgi:2'-5' RNA ligase